MIEDNDFITRQVKDMAAALANILGKEGAQDFHMLEEDQQADKKNNDSAKEDSSN